MLTRQWIFGSFALLAALGSGIAAAQEDRYPVITPDNIAQVQEVQRLGTRALTTVPAWAPDGVRLAAGADGGFWVYPAPEFYPLDETFHVTSLLFAPQDELVLVGDGQTILAYDLTENAVRYTLEGIRPLTFNHRGDWIAYEVDDGVRIGTVATGETVYDLSYLGRWPEETQPGDDHVQRNNVTFARFLPDGSALLTKWDTYYSATWEGRLDSGYDLWSLADDPPTVAAVDDLYTFVPRYPDLVSVLPDGRIFAVDDGVVLTDDSRIMLQSAPTRQDAFPFGTIFAVQGWTAALSFRPQDGPPAVGIWDVRTGEQLGQIPASGALALSPDSRQIAVDTTVYDVATGAIAARLYNQAYRILPGTDRILRLDPDGTVHLLDAADLEEIATLDVARREMVEGAYYLYSSYVVYPETLLVRSQDARRWLRIDLDTGDTLTVFETSGAFTEYVMVTPDNDYLITQVTRDNATTFTLWDVASGQPIDLPPMAQLVKPILSPNGLLVMWHSEAYPGANEVMLYHAASRAPVMFFPVPRTDDEVSPAPEISFSPGGSYLEILTPEQFFAWDWWAGKMELSLDGIVEPTFSPDDALLAYRPASEPRIEVVSMPEGELVWQTGIQDPIYSFGFVTNTILTILAVWPEVQDDLCYDVITGQCECPAPPPISPALEAGGMRFFNYGSTIVVQDPAGADLARIALPHDAARLALSSTRLWVEYSDNTLGGWAVSRQRKTGA